MIVIILTAIGPTQNKYNYMYRAYSELDKNLIAIKWTFVLAISTIKTIKINNNEIKCNFSLICMLMILNVFEVKLKYIYIFLLKYTTPALRTDRIKHLFSAIYK